MKNKLWKQWMLSGVLVSAMVVSCGVSVSVQAEETTETEEAAETDSSAESEDDLRILFDQAVEDAMIAEDGEILPVVSLDEGEPYAVYNEEGRVLLYTFHKYPDSYPDGTDVKLEWGNVWTFTGGELEDWYQENKEGVTDWQTRMKELLGLTPDNESNYVTAMWVKPEDVFRPAYISDIGTVEMTDSFSEDVDADYKAWFDANIISSYYDGEYPWTRLGYTYDWADNGQAYGLSEFIVKQDSDVKVAYTVELGAMIQKLEDELNTKLFDRTTQPVQPTLTGRKVIEQARITLRQANLIKDIVKEEACSLGGIFRIGVLPTIAPYLLPRFFPELMEEYPSLDIRVTEMKTQECLEALKAGELEAVLIAGAAEGAHFHSIPLYYESFLGYVSRHNALFKRNDPFQRSQR